VSSSRNAATDCGSTILRRRAHPGFVAPREIPETGIFLKSSPEYSFQITTPISAPALRTGGGMFRMRLQQTPARPLRICRGWKRRTHNLGSAPVFPAAGKKAGNEKIVGMHLPGPRASRPPVCAAPVLREFRAWNFDGRVCQKGAQAGCPRSQARSQRISCRVCVRASASPECGAAPTLERHRADRQIAGGGRPAFPPGISGAALQQGP